MFCTSIYYLHVHYADISFSKTTKFAKITLNFRLEKTKVQLKETRLSRSEEKSFMVGKKHRALHICTYMYCMLKEKLSSSRLLYNVNA